MIGYLEGTVHSIRTGFAVLSVGGVGYKVAVLKETLARTKVGGAVSLWTYLAVREDALDLYGFLHEEELRFFELLLTVSGIGPKSALAVLDIASVETLRSAISAGNAGYLTTVSGIGKKTAEKIVLELKDKVVAEMGDSPAALKGDQEALEAMRSLGYSAAEARDALRKVPNDIEGGSDRLRAALRLLGKK
ncbi:Holliday junction DNA helicase RuvA [Candidatus Kaiserbacteria bacterium RIFCSPHIGHO2_02_FULL_55_25]|uniref:Holliday junction branch migration complex subunit RuvA n=1 Tax=Candidatus Kaiserbacteria bacterium RIFCSPHIGHO2_02_FULL_55_25 TaxID=1798498 RepID=A0A1F6E8Z7_9BACT|nr:MAG: Holliday junction DNA helicase RuvA [Candidatus Kaiserbacteria bacterium RIFCSPHIGHO2_02_FULL_55_25]OGG77207.1 MAG: Holliday junction DNA helicase RuvA [Candidatus Kaiserbacteria bacterium RIFCSPHIGHO2_12_FULL_55_13]OGG83310.1 MAG: Holliday junction DNA helicase RuvA [Candidatus Kaiserbacteria bacterium RIFCSPLOWO2_01_FULL_55_25]